MTPARRHLGLAAILLLAAGLRTVWILDAKANDPLFPSSHLFSDGLYYHEWARALAEGRAFAPEPADRPFWIPPLYPHALSLLYRVAGPRPIALVLAQHLVGLLGLVLVHRLTRRVFGGVAAALASLLATLYLPLPFFEGKPMAETVAWVLAAGALAALPFPPDAGTPRRAPAAAAGALLGLAACARPQLLLAVPAVAAAFLGAGRRRLLPAFLLAASLAPAACLTRNLVAGGAPVLVSANGGVNFYFGNHAGVRGTFDAPGPEWSSIFEQRRTALAAASKAEGRPVDERGASAHFFRRGLAWIASEPGEAARALAAKAACLVSNDEVEVVYSPRVERELAGSLRLFLVPFAALLGLAAAGLAVPAAAPAARAVFLLFLAANAAASLLFFPYSRFRLLLLPALLPLAGAGAARIAADLRGRRLGAPLVVAAIAASISLLAPCPEARRMRGNAWVDVGNAWRAEGRVDRAIDAYRRSREVAPSAKALLAIAEAHEETGRWREAERELVAASGGSAFGKEARYRLGRLYLTAPDHALRRPAEARRLFEELLRDEPDHYEARCGLGTAHLGEGAFEEARKVFDAATRLAPARPEGWTGLARALDGLGRPGEAAAARVKGAELRTN